VQSERLRYSALTTDSVDDFHALVQDEHVRRYLLDGNVFPREWSEERARESESLFARRGVGLWLCREHESGALLGFCGFMELGVVGTEPELVYALFERFGGKGYATEMARASLIEAQTRSGFEQVLASVDEINAPSLRILEKVGFERFDTRPGSFGSILLLRRTRAAPRAP
jgi:RimJ/RimL family protein N-acetyltransferase